MIAALHSRRLARGLTALGLWVMLANGAAAAERASRFFRESRESTPAAKNAAVVDAASADDSLVDASPAAATPPAATPSAATPSAKVDPPSARQSAAPRPTERAARPPVRFERRSRANFAVKRAAHQEPIASDQAAPPLPAKHDSQRGVPLAPRRIGSQPLGESLAPLATTLGSLLGVLLLFLMLVVLMRRGMGNRAKTLPKEAVEVLGRAPLFGRQQVHLLRVGNKMLLVHATPASVETLTEIVEPSEVDRLAGLCYQQQSHSATAGFRQTLERFGGEPTARGESTPRRGVDLATLELLARKSREKYDA